MHQNLLCILIHILKTPTQSFSSMPPWQAAGVFFLCFMYLFCFFGCFFLKIFFLNQCPSVSLSMMETRTLYIRFLGRWVTSNCRITKGENSNVGHIPLDEPKLPMWANLLFFIKIHRYSMYIVGVVISSLGERHGHLGRELIITHTQNTQKHTKILYL